MGSLHKLPVGQAPFRLFPAHQVDADGAIGLGDLFDALASVSGLVARVVQSDELDTFTETERNGLALMANAMSEAFERLGEMVPAAIDRAVDRAVEPVAESGAQRGRRHVPDPAGVPDLTEPADPPRAVAV